MRPLYPLLPLALALIVVGGARAETLSVPLNHSVRLNVVGAQNVVVGNPKIADVTVVDSRTVFVSGRGYGASDIVITGQNGRTLFTGDVVVVRPTSSISVYHGLKRSDVACAVSCSEVEGGGDAAPAAAPAQP
jgi:Flp pilus assembly secretin CpaC